MTSLPFIIPLHCLSTPRSIRVLLKFSGTPGLSDERAAPIWINHTCCKAFGTLLPNPISVDAPDTPK